MSRLVTVIPVYNGERFLRATLDSVASQSHRPDRVIIQDNCSTDATAKIAREFESQGFEWRLNEAHISSTENFNDALRYAEETEVLHLLTADDLIAPDFYERLLEPLDSLEGRALAYSAFEVIGEDGVLSVVPAEGEPVEALQLVRSQRVVRAAVPRRRRPVHLGPMGEVLAPLGERAEVAWVSRWRGVPVGSFVVRCVVVRE